MSALLSSRPKAVTLHVRQRAQNALSPLNLHIAGLVVVGLINLYLLIHMGILWQQAKGQDAEAVSRQEVALKTARIAAQPLEGLDVKLRKASADADSFYVTRLPVSYSEVAQEIGAQSKRQNVRLTRVQYAQSGVTGDAAGQLTEVRMDAALSGDYRPLVLFLNSLERDKIFFLINGVTLTGQQTGTVNLRIRITTYIRGMASEAEAQRVAVGVPEPATTANAGGAQ